MRADERKRADGQNADECRLREAAIRQLAVRERSAYELRQKLLTLSDNGAQIMRIIDSLQEENLQSDERFTDVYVRSYQTKGHGPLKIRASLVVKGIHEALISQYLKHYASDWPAVLQQQFEKKYQQADFLEMQRKAKIYRFFQGKGFSFEHIRQLEKTICRRIV